MNATKPNIHFLKTAKYLWLGILLCAAVGLVAFWGGRLTAGEAGGSVKPDTVVLENQLSGISELATVSYHYTNMAQFENSSDFYGVKVPFTTKSFILTYSGQIKAGVDLKDVDVTVKESAVTVKLPGAKILSHEIDEDSVEIFDEKASIFNPFTVEDFTAFQADQKAAVERKATEQGLLSEAQKRAEDSVRLLLKSELPETYTLTVDS